MVLGRRLSAGDMMADRVIPAGLLRPLNLCGCAGVMPGGHGPSGSGSQIIGLWAMLVQVVVSGRFDPGLIAEAAKDVVGATREFASDGERGTFRAMTLADLLVVVVVG